MKRRFLKLDLPTLSVIAGLVLLLGLGAAVAIGAGETTGTNTACATATVPDQTLTAPTHTLGYDGTGVYSPPADTLTASGTTTSACNTATYTIPTSSTTTTETGPTTTITVTSTPTTTSSTSSTSSSSSSSTSSTTSTTTTTPPPTCPTRCFYIANTGSDSSSGTSESSPWAHAPGMPSFTGAYTHQAGDRFVFQGGNTWGAGNFPLTPKGSGASGSVDYYGVDPTWFTGSAFTQPTFTDGGASSTTFVSLGSLSYITVDNIHFTGFHWTGTSGAPRAMIFASAPGTHQSVTNSLFDGWSHDAGGGCSGGNCDDGWAVWNNQGTGFTFQGNQVDQSAGAYDSGGAYDENGGSGTIFDHNACFHVEQCYQASGGGVVSNNSVYQMGFGDYDPTNHQNDISVQTGNTAIFNNVVHDTFFGSFTIDYHASGTNYVYNNVVWNNGREAIDADCSLGGGCATSTNYLYNNTTAPGSADGGFCFRFINRGSGENTYSNVTETNNHCVGTLNGIDSGASVPGLVQTTNFTQTGAQAAATGYTAAGGFAPISSASPTVDAGTNLTTSCTGLLAALCIGVDGHARATGTTAWDQGAYEFLP